MSAPPTSAGSRLKSSLRKKETASLESPSTPCTTYTSAMAATSAGGTADSSPRGSGGSTSPGDAVEC